MSVAKVPLGLGMQFQRAPKPKVQLAVKRNGQGATQKLKGCGNHQEWGRAGEPRAFTLNSATAAKNDALIVKNNEVDHGWK